MDELLGGQSYYHLCFPLSAYHLFTAQNSRKTGSSTKEVVLSHSLLDCIAGACHNDDNMRGELEAQLQLFDMAELVWSLCEILFIDTQPGIIFTVVLKVDKTEGVFLLTRRHRQK